MAKKKKKGKGKAAPYTYETYKLRHALWLRRTHTRKIFTDDRKERKRKIEPIVFLRDEPGLHVRQPESPIVPTPIVRPLKKEKIAIAYKGFQKEQRVTSCEQKRERRRRAFFGYLNAPHAGKGSSKRLSPRGDRFTVKC